MKSDHLPVIDISGLEFGAGWDVISTENAVRIGVQKALGYKNIQCTEYWLVFGNLDNKICKINEIQYKHFKRLIDSHHQKQKLIDLIFDHIPEDSLSYAEIAFILNSSGINTESGMVSKL